MSCKYEGMGCMGLEWLSIERRVVARCICALPLVLVCMRGRRLGLLTPFLWITPWAVDTAIDMLLWALAMAYWWVGVYFYGTYCVQKHVSDGVRDI